MKKTFLLVLLVALSALIVSTGVFALDEEKLTQPSQLIGTIRFCVEEAQRLPSEIDGAICNGDDDAYDSKMAELAANIAQANSAMADAGIPNTLNLWNIYALLKTKNCGVGAAATSQADRSREELDRVGFKIGAIDPDYNPKGTVRMCRNIPFGTPMSMYPPDFVACSAHEGAAVCAQRVLVDCLNGTTLLWGRP